MLGIGLQKGLKAPKHPSAGARLYGPMQHNILVDHMAVILDKTVWTMSKVYQKAIYGYEWVISDFSNQEFCAQKGAIYVLCNLYLPVFCDSLWPMLILKESLWL